MQELRGVDVPVVAGVILQIRDELDDHRQAINENTVEVEANHERLRSVESRLDLLSHKLDQVLALLHPEEVMPEYDIQPLTAREKDVFLTVYTLTESGAPCSYAQIADELHLSDHLVGNYITNLAEKGIPLAKTYANKCVYIAIEPRFRQVQAKMNILHLDAKLTAWMR